MALTWRRSQVRREDVLSAWSGIRPLASDPDATDTASISRDHVVHTGADGMVTITGGKWTTYRAMAEHTLDAAIQGKPLNQYKLQHTIKTSFKI